MLFRSVISNTNPCVEHSAGAGASGATGTPPVVPATADVVPYVVGAALIGGVIAIATNSGGSSSGTTPAASGGGTGNGGGAGNGGSPGGGPASP